MLTVPGGGWLGFLFSLALSRLMEQGITLAIQKSSSDISPIWLISLLHPVEVEEKKRKAGVKFTTERNWLFIGW